MKRISIFILTLVVSLSMTGQSKLTTQAQLKVARIKTEAVSDAGVQKKKMRADIKAEPLTTMFVVMMKANANAATTIRQMKSAGAVVQSRLGHQLVVSIPIDSIGALERIEGVEHIDNGHQGRNKTDVTRVETGVSQLNGPGENVMEPAYTGKGVTVCLVDCGFDFQHPAFKDADGNTRIKCVYLMDDESGNKFTVHDPDAGEYTMPGTVYDTPELIAKLTTDDKQSVHGTHTAGIAVGSLSPQGFCGMAPEADIVLVPVRESSSDEDAAMDSDQMVELALSFADAYAKQNGQPMVLSASINSHTGPHDGTSTVSQAIAELSKTVIPVFAAGNEGSDPVHISHVFSEEEPSFKTVLLGSSEDETIEDDCTCEYETCGYTLSGEELSIQLELCQIDYVEEETTTVWQSEVCHAKLGEEPAVLVVSDKTDAILAKNFTGTLSFGISDMGNGKLFMNIKGKGKTAKDYWFVLTVRGAEGTVFHAWNDPTGFGGTLYGPEFKDGDSDYSGGDWTCNDRVISVGAYCANVLERSFDGSVTDITNPDDGDDDNDDSDFDFVKYRADDDDEEIKTVLNGIADFSSYGTYFNGVSQPVICAPGVNVVSAYNHYAIGEDDEVDESMEWNGFPYSAESGTSMACPVISGIVALWLQAKPELTLDGVIKVLSKTSRNDEYTKIVPERWGFGKIDAAKGLEYILNSTGIEQISQTAPATQFSYAKGWFTIDGRRLTSRPAVRGIYIHNGRKVAL